nr:hypothetical protein [uncultured Anaerosporobacter sp.]
MKKNFVKKTLATTLALAMVATAMPAAFTTASAAKAPALNKKAKTLYINDNEIGSSFDFNISNKVAKSTYKWTTSNKAVATVNSKGLTKAATKTGKATISCKITLPTKKTKTLKATVTVKENATKVWVKNAPEKEIGIGEKAYDFNSSFSTASGATATDYRTWEIDKDSNTAGATIDAKSGVVTTTKAGEFKVRVRAYQNKAKLAANDTVDSEWLTVKVVSSIKTVAQSAAEGVKVTFDDDMSKTVKASNFTITNKVTKAVMGIKDGLTFSTDGKEVSIATYGIFADNGTYVLKYADKEIEFNTTIGAVESIELATTTCNPNEAKEVKYVLKNANGVDITSTVDAGQVAYEVTENKNGYFDSTKKELTIFAKDSVAKFKLTYHSQKYNTTTGLEEGNKTIEGVVTCVDKNATTYGAYEKYTLLTSDKTAIDWAKVTTTTNSISVGQTRNLFLNAKDSAGKDATGLKFKSGNNDVLLVSSENGYAKLTAVKAGATVVNVYTSNDVYLWSLPITVNAESKNTSLVLSSASVTVSNAANVSTTSVGVTVRNQFGEIVSTNEFTPELMTKLETGVTAPTVSVAKDKLTIDASTATANKTYQYKIKLDNTSAYAVLTVTVKAPTTDGLSKTSTVAIELSSDKFNTTITNDTTLADLNLNIKVIAKDSNGVAINTVTTGSATTVTIEGPAGFDKVTLADSANGNFSVVSGSSIIEKYPVGTYKVTAQYKVPNSTTYKYAVEYFTLTDEQVAPTANVKKTISTATSATGAIAECIEIKKNDTIYAVESFKGTDNGKGSVNVESVKVTEEIGNFTVVHTIAIGRTLTYVVK